MIYSCNQVKKRFGIALRKSKRNQNEQLDSRLFRPYLRAACEQSGHRGGGIGSAFLELAEQMAKGRDRVMELNVHKDNEKALRYCRVPVG